MMKATMLSSNARSERECQVVGIGAGAVENTGMRRLGRWGSTLFLILAATGCGAASPTTSAGGGGLGLTPPLGSPVLAAKALPALDARLASFDITLQGAFNGTVHMQDTGKCGVDALGDVGDEAVRSATFAIGADVFSFDVVVRPIGSVGTIVERSDADTAGVETTNPSSPIVYVDLARFVVKDGKTTVPAQWHSAPGTRVSIATDGGNTSGDMVFWPGSGATRDPHQAIHLTASWHCKPRPAETVPTITVTTHGFVEGTFRARGVDLDWCAAGAVDAFSSGLIEVKDKQYLFYADPGPHVTHGDFPMVDPTATPLAGAAQASFYLQRSNEELYTLKAGAKLTIAPDRSNGSMDATFTEADSGGYNPATMQFHATMTCGHLP